MGCLIFIQKYSSLENQETKSEHLASFMGAKLEITSTHGNLVKYHQLGWKA
jgi:hypothetical protein